MCYAVSTSAGKTLYMHRLLAGDPVGMEVDHINGDGLDNRRENLRVCTPGENRKNTRSFTGASRYKGVSWDKHIKRWRAAITVDWETVRLGHFGIERNAALAYDRAALEYHGSYAHTNFPQVARQEADHE